MDFKVAGTSEGITTMQMDIKIAGITQEIFEKALAQAKDGRAHILGEMNKALGEVRSELSAHAPRIETITIDKSKRSEEHTSELQSLMRISYAVFCLKKQKNKHTKNNDTT